MKSKTQLLLGGFILLLTLDVRVRAFAQDGKQSGPAGAPESTPKPTSAAAAAPKPKLTQEQLEAKFKATLTKATLSGRWCGIQDGKLTPDKEDKYTIVSVAKLGGDAWIIHARIQYGQKDFVAPVPVEVKWAGDTPIITLDNVGLPGGHSYSARVLVYDKTYAGTWSGGDHAGLLNGLISHPVE
jgi:hypothetical protein